MMTGIDRVIPHTWDQDYVGLPADVITSALEETADIEKEFAETDCPGIDWQI